MKIKPYNDGTSFPLNLILLSDAGKLIRSTVEVRLVSSEDRRLGGNLRVHLWPTGRIYVIGEQNGPYAVGTKVEVYTP